MTHYTESPTFQAMMFRERLRDWGQTIAICVGALLLLFACSFMYAWIERPVTSTVVSVKGETALVKYNNTRAHVANNPFEDLRAGDVVKVRRMTGAYSADYYQIVEKVSD